MKIQQSLNLYSRKTEVIEIIDKLKADSKLLSKITEALQVLGNFTKQVEMDIYEKASTEEREYIKIYCYDLDGNIFVICPSSTNKQEQYKIEKITNDSTKIYDLLLAKKFTLKKENIDYIQTSKVYDFKFGRFVTDEKSFYSLFMSDNLGYKIQIEFEDNNNPAIGKELLFSLNQLNKIPNVMEFIDIFYQIICTKQISFYEINLSVFKNFERLECIKIDGNKACARKKVII